jgi:hypothetical protein
VYLDGERRERPTGGFADALRDECGVSPRHLLPPWPGPTG